MRIHFNVRGYIDRRSEQLHAAHDQLEERRFAMRVANRVARACAQSRKVLRLRPMFVHRSRDAKGRLLP